VSLRSPDDPGPRLGSRERLGVALARSVGRLSRVLGRGSGSVIGGRVGLAVAPGLVGALSAARPVALVSGTNGKTTTTSLLVAALGGPGQVVSSAAGANLPPGIVAALSEGPRQVPAVLEVDEAYLPSVAEATAARVLVLLNLSRDQLDRMSEVRLLAARWRAGLARLPQAVVVANADDPLVAWAAEAAATVRWVGAGQRWHLDAVGCPACGGTLVFPSAEDPRVGWRCPSCGRARPALAAWLGSGGCLERPGTPPLPLELGLPGRCNQANAVMALVAAEALGVPLEVGLPRVRAVQEVAGRFAAIEVPGGRVRLFLAKNPAGWLELLDLLGTSPAGVVVVGINAEVADGRDPSWLWDVPFELLAARRVVASGRRALDLAVRLRHAGVAHQVEEDQDAAVRAALAWAAQSVDPPGGEPPEVAYVGNYTAFQALRRSLAGARGAGSRGAGSRGAGHRRRRGERSRPSSTGGPPGSAPGAPGAPGVESFGGLVRRPGSRLVVCGIYPDLLGTYGDGGNAQVLVDRARWRGIDAEGLVVLAGEPLPAQADCYLLGGGEDSPQARAATLLRQDGGLERAVAGGAVVLAICAGFQLLGEVFPGPEGAEVPGLGLLAARTRRGPWRRAVGDAAAEPLPAPGGSAELALAGRLLQEAGPLIGFENHGGATELGPGLAPLGRVLRGQGNDGRGAEGAWSGRILATYLHGPVLALNPQLADALLALVTGERPEPLPDEEEQALRRARLAALGLRLPEHRGPSTSGPGPLAAQGSSRA